MSTYQSCLGLNDLTLDIDELTISGLVDGVLIGKDEHIETATLSSTLSYSYPTLSVNPDLNLTTLTITGLLDSTGSIHTTQDVQGDTFNTLSGSLSANSSSALGISTSQGERWSFQTPSATSTITEIGSGTQSINRLLMDSSTTGVSSWEISDTRSATHRGVISYDHATDIWYIKSVNSTEVMRIEPTAIYIAQNLRPNGTVNIGTSLSRFNEGHFSGSMNAGNSNFAGLNTTGDIIPTTSFTRDVGNVSYKFKDFQGERILLYKNVNTGTTLANQFNINGPSWTTSMDYGISIGCPYSSTSPYHTAEETRICQASTTAGAFSTNIGIISRNTAGTITADYSRNAVINAGRFGINMPSNTLNTYGLELYARDTNLMRLFDSSSNPTLTLSKSGTNTLFSIAGTLAGSNNVYFDMCANAFGTVSSRMQSFCTGTSSACLYRISLANATGVLTSCYDFDYVKLAPSASLSQDLGSTTLIWRTSYINNLYGTSTTLNLGFNNTNKATLDGSTLRPTTTGLLTLGTSSVPWGIMYSNNGVKGTTATLTLDPTGASGTVQMNTQATSGAILINGSNSANGTEIRLNAVNTGSGTPTVNFQGAGSTKGYVKYTNNSTALLGAMEVNSSGYLRLTAPKGVRNQVNTTAEISSITSPDTGAMIYDTTTLQLKTYDGSAWNANNVRDTTYVLCGSATTYQTSTTGIDTGISFAFTAPTTNIEITLRGGLFVGSNASYQSYIGLSTTSGAESYASWNLPRFRSYASTSSEPCYYSIIITNLTVSSSYTYYLKVGSSDALNTAQFYSGGSTGAGDNRGVITYRFF